MAPSQKQQDLNNSVSLMSIKNDSRHERDATERPQTSSSKGSQTSSLTGGSKIFDSDIQKGSPSSSFSRRTADSQFKLDDRKAHPYASEHKVAELSESQKTFVTAQPINRTNSPIVHGRRSEDTRTGPFPTVAPKLDPQRSKTMPNNISEVAQDFSLRRGYENQPIWQEPGPTAGYHGPEAVISPRSTPIDTSQRPTDRLELPVNEMRVAQEGEEVLARGQPPRSQHSAQNSLGEFYDSYYHDSQHDVQASAQDQRNQQPHSPDDEMPNFDAVLETKHRRGISIDFHLQPQPLPQPQTNHSKIPQALTQSQRTNTLPSRPNVHVAGQFSKSKSQPNLKDPRPQGNPHDNGFVFDLPGEVPPIPPLSPMRPKFGPQHSVAGTYPTESRQFGAKESRFPADQRGASPDARSKGSAVLNEPLERTSRKGTPSEHHRLSPSQGDGSRGVQVRNPGGRHSPASARKPFVPPIVTSSNPDSLPPHPTPIRPGLMQVTSSPQAAKPPPMRQYDTNASPLQQPISNQKLGPGQPSNVGGETIPVTHEELEKLRQAVKSHPADQKIQLLLARKLVEAASVLADDGGRADQKARAKNREKYILDAHKIVKKLVSGHSMEATFYLADCYSRGLLGLEVNTKEAFQLYQTAAKSEHAQSAYRVAVCCEMGQEEGGGTKRDPTKAMQWYQRAATLGDTPAMYKLGIIRLKGLLGQSKNPDEALKWLKRAADQANEENPHALHELVSLLV